MCGRYTLTDADPQRLRRRFDLAEPVVPPAGPRFNIAPTDPVLAIRRSERGEHVAGALRWGLVPGSWAERDSRPLINARSETVAEQPAFAESFRKRRCLVPADGFYEWRPDAAGKTPVWVTRADHELFAFAGIWASLPRADGEPLVSCAILTCVPNALVAPLHDRMPVILDPEAEELWLTADAGLGELASVLAPAPDDALVARDVGDAVSDVRQDGPHLIEPRATAPTLF